jgi:hypothetical protein
MKLLKFVWFEEFAWLTCKWLTVMKTKMLAITIIATIVTAIKTISEVESRFLDVGLAKWGGVNAIA